MKVVTHCCDSDCKIWEIGVFLAKRNTWQSTALYRWVNIAVFANMAEKVDANSRFLAKQFSVLIAVNASTTERPRNMMLLSQIILSAL